MAGRVAIVITLVAAFAATARPIADGDGRSAWRMIGHDPANTRNQPDEHKIRRSNVHRLAVKWIATTTGDVSATPAVVDDAVYFGDFGGTLWKLDAETGDVIWSRLVSDYTGIAGDIARTSPSVVGNTLIVGGLRGPNMLGINAKTGERRWMTQVHPDPKGIMTGSPVVVGDTVFTGVSASGAGGPDATFRGAIVALERAHRRNPVADLLAARQRRRRRRVCRRHHVLPARGRCSRRPRLRHIRPAIHRTRERHRLPCGKRQGVRGRVRAARGVL